ncbi:MAG: SDR family oxidoreductase [Dehalococcoidales bacterium]|nr:SDR family oxidoreductase [Dehalococcoidales bacterium]
MDLSGKTALVTGGGTGIGAAITRRLVNDGAKACITGRRPEKLQDTIVSLPEGSVVACSGDVSNSQDIKRIVTTALEIDGKLDILVNNAAIEAMGPVTELDPGDWQQALDINLTGPFMLMKEVIPHMIENGGGSIINISSLGGIRCLPGMPAYCTTKAALIMLTKQVAMDYGPQKIRCNVICPGATRTEMNKNLVTPIAEKLNTDIEGGYKYFTKNVPLRRAAQPDEIAGLCSFLASDDSLYMTGSELLIDGGAAVVDLQGAALGEMLGG